MKLIKKQNCCKKLKPDKIKNAERKLNKNRPRSEKKRPPANVSMKGKHEAKHKFDCESLKELKLTRVVNLWNIKSSRKRNHAKLE